MGSVTNDEFPEVDGPEINFTLGYESYLRWDELKQGVLRINDEIREVTTSLWLREIQWLRENWDISKPIIVPITSPGGGVYYALALYDKFEGLVNNGYRIIMQVEGVAASAAAVLLQAASHRTATRRSRILIHEVRRWSFMQQRFSDLQDETDEMRKLQDSITTILSNRSKKSVEEIKAVLERRETWMGAEEALKFGLIDEVV